MTFRKLTTISLLTSCATACAPSASSGQTGSPACPAPISCECSEFIGDILIRARVVDVSPESRQLEVEDPVEFEVEEVLTSGPSFNEEDVGRRLVTHPQVATSCGGKNQEAWQAPAVGTPVLVAFNAHYYREEFCEGYTECLERDCDSTLFGGNLPDTGDWAAYQVAWAACASNCVDFYCALERSSAPILVSASIFADGELLDLGAGVAVPLDEAIGLTDTGACFEAYPPPNDYFCDDTPGD